MGRGTPLPVVHYALTKTQAESLRRRECNRLVFRVFKISPPPPYHDQIGEEECDSPKNNFNVVREMKVIK